MFIKPVCNNLPIDITLLKIYTVFMCIRYKFYSILVLFCLFVANAWAVTLPNGVEAPCEDVKTNKKGNIISARLLEPRELETPMGVFTFLGSVSFDTNSQVELGELENEVEITTSIGIIKTNLLWFMNGKLCAIRCAEGTKIETPIGEVELIYNKAYNDEFDKINDFVNGMVFFDKKGVMSMCAFVDINKANVSTTDKEAFACLEQSLAMLVFQDGDVSCLPPPKDLMFIFTLLAIFFLCLSVV